MSDELRAMQLYLHPTRREALTASATAIRRWSLETNPATILAEFSTGPESLFDFSYSASVQLLTTGGITGSPDGLLFAHERLGKYGVIEWRRWDDFSLARSSRSPGMGSNFASLACSPDGRWLVIENGERLFLLDWQTGEVMSHHYIGAICALNLTFDATSTFVAGVLQSYDPGCFLRLWRLNPAEHFVPRPPDEYHWPKHLAVGQDEVSGGMALTALDDYDYTKLWAASWSYPDLGDPAASVMFSPDSHIIIFSLNAASTSYNTAGCFELMAYEVPSGKLLWSTHNAVETTGQATFSPDGSVLLLPELDGDLLVYRAEDGALVQRLPTGLSEPIQALTFDHDGKTLWLATEERLVQYQPQG